MVLNYQRWTPPCGCSFEQEVDSDTGEIKLLFGHTICGGHEDIAKKQQKDKPKNQSSKDSKKQDIINKKIKAWDDNKTKNIADFENTEESKRIKDKVAKVPAGQPMDTDTKLLNDYYLQQKGKTTDNVDNFTKEKRTEMLIGLECPYSLDAQDVYDTIIQEQQAEAAVTSNG